MLKMYQEHSSHSGNTPDFWEENWDAAQFEESVRFMANDPLRPLFEKYLRPDSLMLEGGCGMGNYIAYYAERGYNVIGLDFAQRALKTLHTRQPKLKLCGGDVSKLPFADRTFDLYYSGGVVEHFESGAAPSLKEAHRVLKDDGVLLISVPYYSPLRRCLTPFRKGEWRKVSRSQVDDVNTIPDRTFFQYAYRPPEFQNMLEEAGLGVLEKQGYAVLWGLTELPFMQRNGGELAPRSETVQREEPVELDIGQLVKDRPASLVKRLVVREDSSVPVLGVGVKLMRWSVANMMMYVCRRK